MSLTYHFKIKLFEFHCFALLQLRASFLEYFTYPHYRGSLGCRMSANSSTDFDLKFACQRFRISRFAIAKSWLNRRALFWRITHFDKKTIQAVEIWQNCQVSSSLIFKSDYVEFNCFLDIPVTSKCLNLDVNFGKHVLVISKCFSNVISFYFMPQILLRDVFVWSVRYCT